MDYPCQPEAVSEVQIPPLPSYNKERIRNALINYVRQQACYRADAAKRMNFGETQSTNIFQYTLDSYTEKRETANCSIPYEGESVDGPENGIPPQPWDVRTSLPVQWEKVSRSITVPHTETVRKCSACISLGWVRCKACNGRGGSKCLFCPQDQPKQSGLKTTCTFCHGIGYKTCFTCSKTGKKECKDCSGKGYMKYFVKLTISWSNHTRTYIYNTTKLPSELTSSVPGKLIVQQVATKLKPLNDFPCDAIGSASVILLEEHTSLEKLGRIVRQRHCVTAIPATEVQFHWKSKTGFFYIYGYEEKIWFPEYPQKCTIL